ncbi:Outer membrane protein assembly factor BamB precursor [Roseovarius sp. THAF8]|uniref:PQQ-like beta-propeller repeat protein n=1 Tax=Roseovarius sp. THAF8 TaxID=2587846 RepID=UPI0012693318|nr:PQQ-like beta-propeller repeat protein [Roseovarius sp. THAF8]QFT96358.1 Outer membrane protein assembly factor BamB precursor [Roseovarius sp. THAF8]
MAVKTLAGVIGLSALCLVAACAKKENILTGERQEISDILQTEPGDSALAPQAVSGAVPPLALPAARSNASWAQSISNARTRVAHPALRGTPQLAWTANIGQGDSRKSRITADPVVGGGRVYTLDSRAQVTAVSTSGQVIWTRDLVPANDGAIDGSGGGLAYDNGQLFVSSGFGLLTAIDAATGQVQWQQNLRATGSGSPTVAGDLVYAVAGDELAWALDRTDGRIAWQLEATSDIRNVLGAPSPAVSDKYVVFGFGSGEVQGAFLKGGLRRWTTQIAGKRRGYSSGIIEDVTGEPVIEGNTIFAGNHSGRTVALNLGNGERLWTAADGPLYRVWPAGDSIFMVSDRNELLRLAQSDGRRLWGVKLPFFTKSKPKKQARIFAHHGPIIAGGRLIIASSDGLMRFFDPTNGASLGQVQMPGGATTNPVVAGNTLYVVSSKGQLMAFR